MNNEILESICTKTMDCFEEYKWGVTSDDKICVVCGHSGFASVYDSYKYWLFDWLDDIMEDLRERIIYLTKREYLYIYNLLNRDDLRNAKYFEILEDYFCEEEK